MDKRKASRNGNGIPANIAPELRQALAKELGIGRCAPAKLDIPIRLPHLTAACTR